MDNARLMGDDDEDGDDVMASDLDSEDRLYKEAERKDKKDMIAGRDNESSGESDNEGDKPSLFVNPLAKKPET